MDSRPVFVVITATTCGACVGFKRSVWKSGDKTGYREAILKNPNVRLVEIEVPDTSSPPDPKKYPFSLRKWARWYPTIMLFTGASWNQASPEGKKGPVSGELAGVILNGDFVNGQAVGRNGPRDPASINAWITQQLTTNPIFKTNQPMASSGFAPPPIPFVNGPGVPQANVPGKMSGSPQVILTNNGQPLTPGTRMPTIGQIAYQDREIDSMSER